MGVLLRADLTGHSYLPELAERTWVFDSSALTGQLSKIYPYRIKKKSEMFYYITD